MRRRCCWPTSPRATCTPRRRAKSWSYFSELNRQGTTIVQVTHSEENARYSKRIVELRDGWLTRDEKLKAESTEVAAS